MDNARQLTVLLVDDSDLVACVVTEFLEQLGMKVVRGSNGAEGVELAYSCVPDVIVMDAEMPLMQGYLASRLLKNQRGVRDIPIIMHTGHSEDKDKYWAMASGADDFVPKNFDSLHTLSAAITRLVVPGPIDTDVIARDGASLTRDRLFEMLGSVLDRQLFSASLTDSLAKIGKYMTSLPETAHDLLSLVYRVCEPHISVLLTRYDRKAVAYVLAAKNIPAKEIHDFVSVCLSDFYHFFPDLDLVSVHKHIFEDTYPCPCNRIEGGTISSYTSVQLPGRGDSVIGTLHVGNCTNNYFSEQVRLNLEQFALNAGMVLDNAILFNHTNEMQLRIKNAFAKYVPGEVIDTLISRNPTDGVLAGEKRTVTVLFSDIRNFTRISEENTADSVVELLNKYFNMMVSIIKKHGGTIDKFIGDAILAVFGAPTSYPDNTVRAVKSAIEMVEALPHLNTDGLWMPDSGFDIGIGIHAGEVIVGNIGSQEKSEYTVIGDTVNLASRIEGLTKHYRRKIIVSDCIAAELGPGYPLREIDSVRVKGKASATRLYTVMTAEESGNAIFNDLYSKGLSMCRLGNWSTAGEYLSKALAARPEDHSSRVLLERCRQYAENPPEAWDGSEVLDFK